MFSLARETNPELIKQAALLLERENEKLAQKLIALTKENLELKGQTPEALQLKIAQIEEQLAWQRRKIFGESSERQARGDKEPKEKAPRTGHGPQAQPALPIEVVEHKLDDADRPCPACGGQLGEWAGQFEESEEIDVVERRFVLKKHRRQKYRCRCQGCVETAEGPEKLFAGARYSIDFAIEVATQKYLDHLPLERQVRIMAREGLVVTSQTLWDQLEALAKLLSPAHARLHAHLLSQDHIGVDETFWRVMGTKHAEENKRWQSWAVVANDGVSYRIFDSRSAETLDDILDGFRGVVMSDGYAAYEGLSGRSGGQIVSANCWAHVRRKFIAALESSPVQAQEAVELIRQLYEVELEAATGPPEELLWRRAKLRDEKSRALIAKIEQWALGQRVLGESSLGKAIAYMGKLWPGLIRFLDDPRVPLDNNATERALRGVVLGRKNHYGSRSRRGTEVAALFYSLLESAKLCGVEPKTYLKQATLAALRGEQIALPCEMKDAAAVAG